VDRMAAGEFTVALVEGGPCSGKGAVMKVLEAYAREKGASVLHGVCRGWEIPEPYQAITMAVNQALMARGETRTFPDCMFQMPSAESERIDVSRAGSGIRMTQEAIWKFMKETVGEKPLLLSINNFQWASPATCLFLDFLFGLPEKGRLMLVLAYRPEELDDPQNPALRMLDRIQANFQVHRLVLGHLYLAEIAPLMRYGLGFDPPDELLRYVAKESGGVPAHILWLVRHLARTGVIDGRTGRWAGEPPGPKAPPAPSLKEILRSAVSALTPDAADLLKAIAISGWAATGTILEEVLERSPGELEPLGKELVDAGFISIDGEPGSLVFGFREGLTRECIYDNIKGEERRRLHWRTGNAIEKYLLGQPEGSLFVLAHHFSLSGDIGKAIQYTTMAGDLAIEMQAYEEALAHYEFALTTLEWEEESAEKKAGELRLLSRLGAACLALRSPERSLEFHARVLRLAEEVRDAPRRAESLVKLGEAYLEMGEWAMALKDLKRGLAAALEAGDARTTLLARLGLAGAYCRREVYHKGIEYMEKVTRQQLTDSELKRKAAIVWLDIGAHVLEGSRKFIESAQALFRTLGDTESLAQCEVELSKLNIH